MLTDTYPKCPRCSVGKMVPGLMSGPQCSEACERAAAPVATQAGATFMARICAVGFSTSRRGELYAHIRFQKIGTDFRPETWVGTQHYSLMNPFTLQVLREFLHACGVRNADAVPVDVPLQWLSAKLQKDTTSELLVECYWKIERSFRGGTRPMLRFVVP